MNKLFTKIATLSVGLAMAVGVGVAVGNNGAEKASAALSPTPTWSSGTPAFGSSYKAEDKTLNGTTWYVSCSGNNTSIGWNTQTVNNPNYAPLNTISETTKYGAYQKSGGWDVGKIVISFTNSDSVSGTWYIWYSTNSGTSWTLGTTGTLSSSTTSISYDHESNLGTGTRFAFGFGTTKTTKTRMALSNIQVYAYENKTLSSIAVTDNSGKTWHAGDTVVASDLQVVASYSNGDSATITDGTGVTITSGATLVQGSNTVGVSYTDAYGTATGSVSITAAAAISLSSIAVTTAPSKTTYNEGETFSSAGMVVTATYSDSSTANVTASCTFTPSGALTTSDTSITISYTYKGVERTASQAITVNAVTEVTFTAGTDVGTTTTNNTPDEVSKYGFTISSDNAAFATAEYRLYQNSATTISVASGKIGKITIVKNGSYAYSLLSADVGTWNSTTGVWTGNAASVTFTASAQFRANSFTIEKASTTPTLTLSETAISLKTNESAGQDVTATVINVNNPAITWTANNNNVTIETGSLVDGVQTATIKPNTNADASSTITVAVTGTTLSATITVTISVPGPGETIETAYTASQAAAAIASASGDIENIYVSGIISQVDQYYSSSHSINYWISDDGTTTGQFKIYGGKGLNGANFNSVDEISVGDRVVLFGTISKQYSNLNSGNYIVSRTPAPQVNSITLTPAIVTVAPEAAGDIIDLFTSIVINQDEGSNKTVNDIVWSSDDANVFYIDGDEYLVAGEHKESTTLRASIGGKEYGSAEIEIVDPNHPYISYDVPVEWTKLSSISVGDVVAFVSESASNELTGVSTSGTTIGTVSEYDTNPSGTYLLTIEAGNGGAGYAFKTKDNTYLSWSSGNSLTTSNDKTDNASWTINETHDGTDGEWKFTNVGDTTRVLQYNTGSPRFACYGNDGQAVFQIYKKTGGDVGTVDLDNTILTLVRSHMATYKDNQGNDQYGIAVCDYNRTTPLDKDDWDDIGADFTASIISTYHLAYARSNAAGNDVEKFLSAYDYVVENYGASYDFLGRIASGKVTVQNSGAFAFGITESNNATAMIVIISIVSLTAIGGFFFLRKKKEQ